MSRKAQFDYPIISFVMLVIGLIIAAPFLLKIINSFRDNLPQQIGNLTIAGSQEAATTSYFILNTTSNIWDGITIFLVIGALLILLVSSFMIDTHPFWMVLYIMINLLLVLFLPDIVESLGTIYGTSQFATENTQLSFMGFLITHFGEILVGVMVLSGIIIYGKISFFSSNAGMRQ